MDFLKYLKLHVMGEYDEFKEILLFSIEVHNRR